MAPNSARVHNLADVLKRQLVDRGAAPALSFNGVTQTYAELDKRSAQTTNALRELGVGRGERVAILSRNAPVFFELAFAVARINAQMVGLNWRLAAPEIAGIVADAEPTVILVAEEFEDLLNEQARATPNVRVFTLTQFAVLVDSAATTDVALPDEPADVVCVLYTSGTTGLPKGVQLSHDNFSYSGWIAEHAYGVTDATVNLVAMPLFHVGGLGYGLSAFMHGGHTVLLQAPEASQIIAATEHYRVTHSFFVPAVIQMLLASDTISAADLSSLELLVYGASPISDAVLREAIRVLGCEFVQAYGMTETAGSIVALPAADHDPDGPNVARLRACGKALPWIELRLVDPKSGDDVPVGEVGEIWTRSPQNTAGYRNKPEETQATILPDGWLRTGDAAYQDVDGYIYLFDRYKDMIVSGSENVYPAEVENVLYDHPAVVEVAVIGVPDERWGETVKAMVVKHETLAVDADELIAFARTRLARYKCPTSVDFVASLPRNASGKLLKTELRAPFWANQHRRIS